MDAYLVLRIGVGASIQEQPHHGQMTIHSGEDELSEPILRETGKQRNRQILLQSLNTSAYINLFKNS